MAAQRPPAAAHARKGRPAGRLKRPFKVDAESDCCNAWGQWWLRGCCRWDTARAPDVVAAGTCRRRCCSAGRRGQEGAPQAANRDTRGQVNPARTGTCTRPWLAAGRPRTRVLSIRPLAHVHIHYPCRRTATTKHAGRMPSASGSTTRSSCCKRCGPPDAPAPLTLATATAAARTATTQPGTPLDTRHARCSTVHNSSGVVCPYLCPAVLTCRLQAVKKAKNFEAGKVKRRVKDAADGGRGDGAWGGGCTAARLHGSGRVCGSAGADTPLVRALSITYILGGCCLSACLPAWPLACPGGSALQATP